MALRSLRGWQALLAVAYSVLIVWLTLYWVGLIDRILVHEETKTLSQALHRLWRTFELALSPSTVHGNVLGVIATLYREILMPALQVFAVIALLTRAAMVGSCRLTAQWKPTRAKAARAVHCER